MAITKAKILSLLVFAAVAVIVITALNAVAMPAIGIFIALLFSLFGLMLIWFAEPLAEVACFSRGVPRPSPSGLIMFFGWVFLIGYPFFLSFVGRAV
jgi:FtsH-binding integral membrane protein